MEEYINNDKELRNTKIVDNSKYINRGVFERSELKDFYGSNIERIATNLNLIKDSKKYIDKLKENGNKIIIITGRDNGELYSKIGNEILSNYKIYQSTAFVNREKDFISKHINDLKFKSRYYKKQDTINDIAKELYKICQLANLNYNQTLKVFTNWIKKSNYNQDPSSLLRMSTTLDTEMRTTEYYNALKKLGYDSDRYNKIKDKYFYQELNYKKFINQAMNYLTYELEQEEK